MKKSNEISTLSKKVEEKEKFNRIADLEQALDEVGLGTYNIKYSILLTLFLPIVEPIGNGYLLPASKCDLGMSDATRGVLASLPYIGAILTAFPWGYLVDTRGRKPVLIVASMAAGFFGVAAACMPDLISFTICKFLSSLCIACPASASYTFIGEIVPMKYRDFMLTISNSLQILNAALVPLYAWAILPGDFSGDFGEYIRPWRVLCIVYSLHYLVPALLLLPGPESPKYLLSHGLHDEAMAVLRTMYAANKGTALEDFPIKSLKMLEDDYKQEVKFLSSLKQQSFPLLKPPYLKWLLLNGFLLFGVLSILNGLAMWIPDALNRVLSGSGTSGTACEVISRDRNIKNAENVCDNSIDTVTFAVNATATVASAVISLILCSTVKVIGKKLFLILSLLLIGLFCVVINVTTQPMVFAVLLSGTLLVSNAIGPINAYSVEIFPTKLRGMGVGLTMMIGRAGSIAGAIFAGAMINVACEAMFYIFGGLMIGR